MSNPYLIERSACPACRSTQHATLYSRAFCDTPVRQFLESYYRESGRIDMNDLKDADYTLLECRDCGLVYQNAIPGERLMERLYRERTNFDPAKDRSRQHSSVQYYARHAELMLTLASHFRKAPHEIQVFDFGLGWAELATMAVASGFETYGAELVEAKRQFARSHGVHVIEWEEIPEHRFDYINADWIFEHLPRPLDTLAHLRRGLSEHGIIKISVPIGVQIKRQLKVHNWNAPKNSRHSLNAVHPLEHLNCFEGNSLDKMAAHCELKPFKFPLREQYMIWRWGSAKEAAKAMARPFYHNWFWKADTHFFTPNGSTEDRMRLPESDQAKRASAEATQAT